MSEENSRETDGETVGITFPGLEIIKQIEGDVGGTGYGYGILWMKYSRIIMLVPYWQSTHGIWN